MCWHKEVQRPLSKQKFCSSLHPRGRRHPGTRGNPVLVGLEFDAEPVVEDAQGAVAITHHCLRHDSLHLLRHHADVGAVAAVVAEAIVAEPIGKIPEQNDIVLERDVGSSTTATPATAAAATTAATAAAETTTPATTETAAAADSTAAATEAGSPPR